MPTRFVTLMNPSRRRRRVGLGRNRMGRFIRRSSVRRRRTVRTYATRRIRRRRVHRNPSHPPRMTPAMRRKVGAGVRRYYAQRARSRSTSIVRRAVSHVRRFRRPGGFGGGSLTGSFKSALSKPMLVKAGGAVIASFGTGYIMNRFGASLPLATSKWGRIGYTFAIPVAAAWLVRKKSPALAEGLVIGGLVMTINQLMQSFNIGGVTAPAAAPATVSRYAVAGEVGPRMFAAYPQAMARPSAALGGSNAAFPDSAW